MRPLELIPIFLLLPSIVSSTNCSLSATSIALQCISSQWREAECTLTKKSESVCLDCQLVFHHSRMLKIEESSRRDKFVLSLDENYPRCERALQIQVEDVIHQCHIIFEFDNYGQVIPPSPVFSRPPHVESSSASLYFSRDEDFMCFSELSEFPLHIEVIFVSQWDIYKRHVFSNFSGMQDTVLLHDLYPNSQYDLWIRQRPLLAPREKEIFYWSGYLRHNIVTLPAVPPSPILLNEGFELRKLEKPGEYLLTLFWRRVEKKQENGPHFGYLVRAGNLSDQRTNIAKSEVLLHSSFEEDINIAVFSENSFGRSHSAAFFRLDLNHFRRMVKLHSSLSWPLFKRTALLRTNHNTNVVFAELAKPMFLSVRLIGCTSVSCKEGIMWTKEVVEIQEVLSMMVFNETFEEPPARIGLAVEHFGIFWLQCPEIYGQQSLSPVLQVLGKDGDSLDLRPQFLSCANCPTHLGLLVKSWRISAEPTHAPSLENSDLMEESQQEQYAAPKSDGRRFMALTWDYIGPPSMEAIRLEGFQPGVTYSLTLHIESKLGLVEESEHVFVTTSPSQPPDVKFAYRINESVIAIHSSINERIDCDLTFGTPLEILRLRGCEEKLQITLKTGSISGPFQIRSCNQGGCSPWSRSFKIHQAAPAPEILSVSENPPDQLLITWSFPVPIESNAFGDQAAGRDPSFYVEIEILNVTTGLRTTSFVNHDLQSVWDRQKSSFLAVGYPLCSFNHKRAMEYRIRVRGRTKISESLGLEGNWSTTERTSFTCDAKGQTTGLWIGLCFAIVPSLALTAFSIYCLVVRIYKTKIYFTSVSTYEEGLVSRRELKWNSNREITF